ncbi:bifunctional diguanylate cyclase/phosphodiesterase [Sphingomonas sp.]|uniref:putative bifunctional diguanylate cyclase/phosphodiesterase n=1 Tax=Sphingomonas sp. TaxID=28214 RepID=UPI001DCDC7B2|nr:GGDEF and EAL domain-containing protein [Sphingomonas sp.]MBX9795258.1 EAL domain-containing protein [Sphingomonas sp.]
MNSKPASHFAKPRIDAAALLGLRDPADSTDWGPIRAAQVNAGRDLALFLFALNLISAVVAMVACSDRAPFWAVLAWGAAVTGVSLWVTTRRLSSQYRGAYSAPVAAVRDTLLEGVALGVVWAVPPLALITRVGTEEILGLVIVITALMTALAVAMPALPLAVIAFLLLVGSATVTMVALISGPVLAATMALFTLLLMIGCVTRAHSLVTLRANEMALAERDETLSLLLNEEEDQSADWLWEIDAQRRIVRASARFAYALDRDPATINKQPLLQLLAGPSWDSGTFAPGLRLLAEKLKKRESFRDLLLPVNVKGADRWWQISASPRLDEEGKFVGFRGVGSDVTEARASADQINRLARYDMLTGLPNRLMISETLTKAMADAEKWNRRCAFMMIDLDRFKAVNDTLGHPIGDQLLERVAERLAALMGPEEMVGRLGGDEFAVVVRDASDARRVETLAAEVIAALTNPYDIDHHTLHVGASIGIAFGPRDGKTAETLIRSADLALYRSKDAGGGVYHLYERQLHVEAEERRTLEMALRRALANGELSLFYQPVVRAGCGTLLGFEALVRWQHPDLGMIPPSKFIPIAEESRLIGPIGDWVLRTACAEVARWRTSLRVAVNVSPQQLHNQGFATTVAQALATSGIGAEQLELEVTESVFMEQGTVATQVLERVLDLGVKLSLDDFGTGYSSLGYLSRTRFSSIKIDRSFVQAAAKGEREAIAIIRAVVALAQSLGMATTAEGVETDAEHRLIQSLGCTKVQGYFFGRPLPVEEARALAAPVIDDSAAA